MQQVFAYPQAKKVGQATPLSRFESSIVAVICAVMLFMMNFALVSAQTYKSDSAENGSLFSSSQFLLGTPLQ
jgi:hypothetical protein